MSSTGFDDLNDDLIIGKPETALPHLHTYEEGGNTKAIERIKQRQLVDMNQHRPLNRYLNAFGYGVAIIGCLLLAEIALPHGIKPTDFRNEIAYRMGLPGNWLHEEQTFATDFAGLRGQLVKMKGWCGPAQFIGLGDTCNQAIDSYAESAYSAAKQYHGLK